MSIYVKTSLGMNLVKQQSFAFMFPFLTRANDKKVIVTIGYIHFLEFIDSYKTVLKNSTDAVRN